MQVPAPFDYERATSVDHAIGLLDRLGSTARLVAGGHSLLPMMKLRLANFEYLIDINDLHRELGYIRVEPTQIRIGAMTRHRELLESHELRRSFPIFHDAERVIADPLVRNRGTIGGSLCQADPSEDLSAVCTTLDASCVIRGPGGERVVTHGRVLPRPVRDGGRRRRDAHRGAHSRCGPNGSSAFEKVGRRAGDWAVVSCGVAVWVDGGVITDARVGLAAVGPNTTGIPAISAGAARPTAVGGALRRGRRHRGRATARPSPTSAAAPTTSATSPPS